MSIINFDNNDGLGGYEISGNATAGDFLLFNGTLWVYTNYGGGGGSGLTTLVNVGSGNQVLKNIVSNIGYLRSITSTGNIHSNTVGDEILITLDSTLNSINEINFGNYKIKNSNPFFEFLISDGGASVLNTLKINTQYGITLSTPIEINNLNEIYLNNVPSAAHQFLLGLDINNKIIKTNVSGGITSGENTGAGQGEFWLDATATKLRFRTLQTGPNLTAGTGFTEVLLTLNSSIDVSELSSPNLKIPNLPSLPASGNKAVFLDSGGNLFKEYALNTYSVLGLGESIVSGTNQGDLIFKSLIGGTNINLSNNTNDLTINLPDTITGMTQINNTGENLYIYGQLYYPNATVSTVGAGYALYTDGTNRVFKNSVLHTAANAGFGSSVINSIGVNTLNLNTFGAGTNLSLINSGGTLIYDLNSSITGMTSISGTNLSINGSTSLSFPSINISIPNIPIGTINYNVGLSNTGNLVKASPATTTTIYSGNGQLTTVDRTIQAFLPGSLNRLILDGITLSLQNNTYYAPDNVSLTGLDDYIISAPYGGSASRALWSPYNSTSQKITVSGLGTYKNANYFYQNVLPISGNDCTWNLEIEIVEITNTNNGFVGKYTLQATYSSLVFGTIYNLKSKDTSMMNTGVLFNVLEVIFYVGTGGGGTLNLGVCQVSTNPVNSTYNIFVKDLSGKVGRTCAIINSSTTLPGLINNPLASSLAPYMFSAFGTGTPPSWIINYSLYRDFIISGYIDWKAAGAISGNFTLLLNGTSLLTRTIAVANNTEGTTSFRRYFSAANSINAGVLLWGNNTITLTWPPGIGFVGKTYELNIEFV